MNIFVLDESPKIAAQMACDKHVVKMILESAQMLSSVHHRYGNTAVRYKEAHPKHPCTLWAGDTARNYAWLLAHAMCLCNEYTHRYGKRHKSADLVYGELAVLPFGLRGSVATPFAQAMPEPYKHPHPVIAYRQYYLGEKAHFAKWTNRDEPLWFTLKQPDLDIYG